MDPHERLRSQIRAARELLRMNQADLAQKLNVSLSKISRVESGETKSGDILLGFKAELEKLGIKFTATGVEIVEDRIEIIEGKNCYLQLLDNALVTLQDQIDKTLYIMFASDRASPKEINDKYREMRLSGIKMKQIIEKGDQYILGPLNEYRAIPQEYFTNIVTLVYANKVAQVNGAETRITVQTDEQLSRKEKLMFQYFWDTGIQPKKTISKERFE